MVGYIIGWLFTGLIVGALARLLVPGRQSIGFGATILLGIVGSLVGGFVWWTLFGPHEDLATTGYDVMLAWPGWLVSILGAVIVLWGYLSLSRQHY